MIGRRGLTRLHGHSGTDGAAVTELGEVGDLDRLAIVQHRKILSRQSGDRPTPCVDNPGLDIDQLDFDGFGIAARGLLLRRPWLDRQNPAGETENGKDRDRGVTRSLLHGESP